MNAKERLIFFLPAALKDIYRRISHTSNNVNQEGLSGDYQSWEAALAASTGYETDIILEKTKDALLKVKNGEAKYERDSVLFDEIQYSWPVLAGLMWAAAQNHGELNVLDFGGSLGSTYFQNLAFLREIPEIRWNVIEQKKHAFIGKKYFQDNILRFYEDIDECLSETTPNVILLSSVLQYLENSYKILDRLLKLPCDLLIIDKTPFWEGSNDRLCVQRVPSVIYPASYPSWIFSREKFSFQLRNKGFRYVAEFKSPDRLPGPVFFEYQGMIIGRTAKYPEEGTL